MARASTKTSGVFTCTTVPSVSLPVRVHRVQRRSRGVGRRARGETSARASSTSLPAPRQKDRRYIQRRPRCVASTRSAAARIERCTEAAGERRLAQCGRRGRSAVGIAVEVEAITAGAAPVTLDIEERDATGEVGVVGIPREECARRFVQLGDDLRLCLDTFKSPRTQSRQPVMLKSSRCRSSRLRNVRTENFTGASISDEDTQFGFDPCFGVLEHAVAEAVPHGIRGPRSEWATRSATSSRPEWPRHGCRWPRCWRRRPGRSTRASAGTRASSRSRCRRSRIRRPASRSRDWRSRWSMARVSCDRPPP